MPEKRWSPLPIYVVESKSGDRFVLPDERDHELFEENIRSQEKNAEILRQQKKTTQEKAVRDSVANQLQRLEEIKAMTVSLRPKAEKLSYEIATPTFEEYLNAEENARDYVTGVPYVKDGVLARHLLAENIRFGDKILTITEIGELEPIIATKLWAEMQHRVRPNIERLPFLSMP